MPHTAHSPSQRALSALGNPVRRRLIELLQPGPQSVGKLADALPVSRPAVSKHLRILEAAALVRHDKDGARNVFELEPTGFEAAREWLDSFWDEALSRFQLVAENTKDTSES